MFVGVVSILTVFLWFSPDAVAERGEGPTALHLKESPPPNISAKSAYVFDIETGQVIFNLNGDDTLPIASVTKLFSSAVYYTSIDLEKEITITESDVAVEGDSGRLEAGQTYLARELLFPALLESSNDAASAQLRLADGDMILSMNALARRYEASDTIFIDSSGLSSQNQSSASSLAKLLRAIVFEYPYIMDITKLEKYVLEDVTWLNNNPLSKLEGYQGGKHGYTHEANRTAAVIYMEPVTGGADRLVGYVVLGSDDLVSDISTLRNYVHNVASNEVL